MNVCIYKTRCYHKTFCINYFIYSYVGYRHIKCFYLYYTAYYSIFHKNICLI